MRVGKKKSGFNLTEIMLAVFILAATFLPIMGVLSNSIRFTSKDDSVIRAMTICQEKLDTALKFPFPFFNANLGVDLTGTVLSSGTLSLSLNSETVKNVNYRYVLNVSDRNGNFAVREKDLDVGNDTPSTWNFNASVDVPYAGIFHRYSMTVFWTFPGDPVEKSYRLVTFRADLRSFGGS